MSKRHFDSNADDGAEIKRPEPAAAPALGSPTLESDMRALDNVGDVKALLRKLYTTPQDFGTGEAAGVLALERLLNGYVINQNIPRTIVQQSRLVEKTDIAYLPLEIWSMVLDFLIDDGSRELPDDESVNEFIRICEDKSRSRKASLNFAACCKDFCALLRSKIGSVDFSRDYWRTPQCETGVAAGRWWLEFTDVVEISFHNTAYSTKEETRCAAGAMMDRTTPEQRAKCVLRVWWHDEDVPKAIVPQLVGFKVLDISSSSKMLRQTLESMLRLAPDVHRAKIEFMYDMSSDPVRARHDANYIFAEGWNRPVPLALVKRIKRSKRLPVIRVSRLLDKEIKLQSARVIAANKRPDALFWWEAVTFEIFD